MSITRWADWMRGCGRAIFTLAFLLPCAAFAAEPTAKFSLYVSNERSGDVSVIDPDTRKVVATIAVGKRPRGIHAGADGKVVYVALSGSVIGGKDDDAKADHSADGIGVIDVAAGRLVRTIPVGTDPEEFDLSQTGTELYVSNEDAKTVSALNIATGKVVHVVPVSQEPEGVRTSPDGKSFYVTCESNGDVFVVDTASFRIQASFKVPVRPRSVEFLHDGALALVPSEMAELVNVVDTTDYKIQKTIKLPPGSRPMRIRLAPDGSRIYVSNGRAATVSVIDAKSFALIGTIGVGTRPWDMTLSPDGKYLYTANGPSDDVSVVDLGSNTEIARIKAGHSPWGITRVLGNPRVPSPH